MIDSSALSALFDSVTFGHFGAVGLDEGWRCWEVGAGGSWVPARLASVVGPRGHVLATDIDTAWLEEEQLAGVEIRTHDVATDDPRLAASTSSTPASCSFTCRGGPRRCAGWRRRCVPGGGW